MSPGKSMALKGHFGGGRMDGCVGQALRDRRSIVLGRLEESDKKSRPAGIKEATGE